MLINNGGNGFQRGLTQRRLTIFGLRSKVTYKGLENELIRIQNLTKPEPEKKREMKQKIQEYINIKGEEKKSEFEKTEKCCEYLTEKGGLISNVAKEFRSEFNKDDLDLKKIESKIKKIQKNKKDPQEKIYDLIKLYADPKNTKQNKGNAMRSDALQLYLEITSFKKHGPLVKSAVTKFFMLNKNKFDPIEQQHEKDELEMRELMKRCSAQNKQSQSLIKKAQSQKDIKPSSKNFKRRLGEIKNIQCKLDSLKNLNTNLKIKTEEFSQKYILEPVKDKKEQV
tara:strand:- start:457 stop:1302 length:846 start_codon:yes stop_codon:yes gene_type:complete